MAARPFNTINGLSVSSDRLDVIYANGDVSATNLVVSGQSNLGDIANIIITGGSANYVLSTDGSGNLSWQAASGGTGFLQIGTRSSGIIDVNVEAGRLNIVGRSGIIPVIVS